MSLGSVAFDGVQTLLALGQNSGKASSFAHLHNLTLVGTITGVVQDGQVLLNELKGKKYSVGLVLACAATAALVAAVALSSINRWLIPSVKLDSAGQLEMSWTKPFWSQWIHLVYIMVNLASAAAGPASERKLKMAGALFQSLTLFNISRPNWIHAQWTFNQSELPSDIKTGKASFDFILPSSEGPQLESAVTAARDYIMRYFQGCRWSPYWVTKHYNGGGSSRTFHADITLNNGVIDNPWAQLFNLSVDAITSSTTSFFKWPIQAVVHMIPSPCPWWSSYRLAQWIYESVIS
jgi:hypothetical protein